MGAIHHARSLPVAGCHWRSALLGWIPSPGLVLRFQWWSPARFDGKGVRSFHPYARTYANGEITHYLRDHGFAIKVPPSWRDLYASGQKLLREGVPPKAVPERLGITAERWREIQDACSIRVIALQPES